MGAQPPVIDVMPGRQLSPTRRGEIIALCEAAFVEDLSTLFESLGDSMHLLIRVGEALLAHACWVECWYRPVGLPPLRTAYVKAVAVAPERQGEGWGTLAMRRVAAAIDDYELGALVTVRPDFYARLGWEGWRGPARVGVVGGHSSASGICRMLLRTPRTPAIPPDLLLAAEWRIGER